MAWGRLALVGLRKCDLSVFHSFPTLLSDLYALAAIAGEDNFDDDNATVKDSFDVAVNNTGNPFV